MKEPTQSASRAPLPALTIDLSANCAWISGRCVTLRPQEHRLLSVLHEFPNSTVAADMLVAALYGEISLDSGRVRLRRLVADLRRRFGPEMSRRVRTVPGVGLVLAVESSETASI